MPQNWSLQLLCISIIFIDKHVHVSLNFVNHCTNRFLKSDSWPLFVLLCHCACSHVCCTWAGSGSSTWACLPCLMYLNKLFNLSITIKSSCLILMLLFIMSFKVKLSRHRKVTFRLNMFLFEVYILINPQSPQNIVISGSKKV